MFPKPNKLKSKEFKLLYQQGIKLKGSYGMLIYQKNDKTKTPKLGIVVNSKIGNAVKRNLMTRRIRHIFRENLLHLSNISIEYILFSYVEDYNLLAKDIKNIIKNIK